MPSGKQVDKVTRALVLAEAKILGKSEAARRNDVSMKSIQNWFKDLETDSELAEKYYEKLGYIQYRWIDQLPKLIESASQCVNECLQKSPRDARTLESAIRALELCSQMQISLKAKKEDLKQLGVWVEEKH